MGSGFFLFSKRGGAAAKEGNGFRVFLCLVFFPCVWFFFLRNYPLVNICFIYIYI